MPIAPLFEPDELNDSVLLTVGIVDDCISGRRSPERYASSLNTFFRILETHRVSGSDGFRRRVGPSGSPMGTGMTVRDDPEGAQALAGAIEAAYREAYGDVDRETAHSDVVSVLRLMAGHAQDAEPDVDATRRFVRALAVRLRDGKPSSVGESSGND